MERLRPRRLKLALLHAVCLVCASAGAAHAGTAGTDLPWNRPLDVVVGNLTGPTGKILAVAAIVIVGLAWAFGRSDEGLSSAGKAMIGIGCLLGAPALIDLLGFEGAVVPDAAAAPLPLPYLVTAGAVVLALTLAFLLLGRSPGAAQAE